MANLISSDAPSNQSKPTRLLTDEIKVARELASIDLVFIARDAGDAELIYAVITPKGRKALTKPLEPPKKKPTFGFLE